MLAKVGFERWEELDLEKLPPYVRAMPTFTPGEGLEQDRCDKSCVKRRRSK